MATAAGYLDVDEWLNAQTYEQWMERFACWLLERGWKPFEPTRKSQNLDGLAQLAAMAQQGLTSG